jgi:hypothetical protein
MWECINVKKEIFWKCMKPLINKLFNETFIKNNLVKNASNPIIHFRCADTPFATQYPYHFQKYKFFKDALDDIKKTINTNNKVTLLYNNKHNSNDIKMKSCDIYVNELKKYLINIGYDVSIESTNPIDDFTLMFYAPAVISTFSSFSFMSGFFGMGKFISAGHIYENNNLECNNCGNWLYKGYDLLHKDVKDYYDTDTVIKQLSN